MTMNVLQEYELNEFEEKQEEVKQQFEITDINSLNWAFRKLKAYKAKEQEISELAKAERERIDYWEEQEKKSINNNIEFFEGLINQYHAKVLAEDPKAKTISTPYGASKARAIKAQPKKADEKAILQHVVENGMDEYIKPTLKWADLKKSLKIADLNGKLVVVDETGQAVPGIEIEPEQIKYSLEVK